MAKEKKTTEVQKIEPQKTVDKEALKAKYGEVKVMVIPDAMLVDGTGRRMLREGYTERQSVPLTKVNGHDSDLYLGPLRSAINQRLKPMLRYEAECTPAFKQVIPYVLLESEGKYFCMKRISGDPRLVGMCSIGTGGHIDEGEDIYKAMYRELKEEVGLTDENIFNNEFLGFISMSKTEVDSVHIGLVFKCQVEDASLIKCLEKEKLEGSWVTKEELTKLHAENKLESWSNVLYESIIKGNTNGLPNT